MGRKIQITRAQILQAGLELIEREGAAAVQIKRLAASLGCSTQPILWQFGSMEAYRQALFQYAVEAVQQRIKPKGADAVLDFWRIGATYVDLAVDTPQLHHLDQLGEPVDIPGMCASFSKAVSDMLVPRTMRALAETGHKKLAIAGGVAANSRIRADFAAAAEKAGAQLFVPPLRLCGDNAAMIGCQGYYEFLAGHTAGPELNAYATMPLEKQIG